MGNAVSPTLPEDWATIDMVNRYTFCPRLFHLMYVEGRWEDNAFTLEGKAIHRRVDRIAQLLPEASAGDEQADEPEGDAPPEIARSVSLAADDLGLMGKLDLVSADPEGREAIPVETKRGRVPNVPLRSYPPERVQLMAQGLLLRRHGYKSEHGYLYFAGSRTRVKVEFDESLENETLSIIAAVRAGRAASEMPPPLEDSPKCWGCSLCGICLPDETRELREEVSRAMSEGDETLPDAGPDPRRLYPARDRATPFYVQEQGARVGKTNQRLTVTKDQEVIAESRLLETSQLVLFGNVQISAQATHLLMDKGIPIVHFSTGAWFHGLSHGMGIENSYNRAAQYAAAADPAVCARFTLPMLQAKIANQRALILRNGSGDAKEHCIRALAAQLKSLPPENSDPGILLGWEGNAAAHYFAAFGSMLKTGELPDFDFASRNRRPPKDPVNALLSFTYALLVKETLVALWSEGLDPWWGLFHRPRHGRPALALDVMEPFRAILADSTVITAINTGMVRPQDFETNANGCAMKPAARKALLRAWEQRLDQLSTHPAFGYRCSWRTILRIQARLLSRWLRGDISELPWPVVR
ncbi:CRISPR-associated endonuclease Cas1 [Roseibacillus persicicus]|uniref:CRISPR-associated endonuclease Cas4g/Cas1g n=1 Tax=Roseibacillus persicicus TaxID=454148 RepID=UPI00398B55F6